MRLLQRYILYELLRIFASLLSLVTVLLVFVGVFREMSESGLGPFQALQILPYIVPSLLPFTIPATLLLTITVVYGRLSGDREITAAKAAGINVLSLLWPAFFLAAVLSVCSLILTDQVIPWAVTNIRRTVTAAMEDIFLDLLRSQHQVTNRERGYSITVMDVEGKRLIRPTFQYTPPGREPVTVQAQEANLEFDLDEQQVILHLDRGHIDIPGHRRMWFDEEERPFPLPHRVEKPKPRHRSIAPLREDMQELRDRLRRRQQRRDIATVLALGHGDFDRLLESDLKRNEKKADHVRDQLAELRTEIHGRFALASSCIFFVLLGSPFAITRGRRQFLTSFFLCFMPILLVYYPLVLLMKNFSESRTLDPAYAMWAGNALLLLAGAIYLRRVLKH